MAACWPAIYLSPFSLSFLRSLTGQLFQPLFLKKTIIPGNPKQQGNHARQAQYSRYFFSQCFILLDKNICFRVSFNFYLSLMRTYLSILSLLTPRLSIFSIPF